MHFIANYVNLSSQKKKVLLSSQVLLSVILMPTIKISILSGVSILPFSNMLELEKA